MGGGGGGVLELKYGLNFSLPFTLPLHFGHICS
jgi:hypothetical protein